MGEQHGDGPAYRDGDAQRGKHDATRPASSQPHGEQEWHGQARRSFDYPGAAARLARGISERVDGARPSGTKSWEEAGQDSHGQCPPRPPPLRR